MLQLSLKSELCIQRFKYELVEKSVVGFFLFCFMADVDALSYMQI